MIYSLLSPRRKQRGNNPRKGGPLFPHHPSLQHPCSASSQWLDCALVSGTPGRLRSMLLRSPLLLLLPCSIPPPPHLPPPMYLHFTPNNHANRLAFFPYFVPLLDAVVASDLGSSHCTCTCNLHLHRSSRLPRSGGLHVNETRLLEALPPVERGQICCGTLSFLFLLSSSLHPLSQVIRTVCTVIPIQSSVLFSPSASWLSPSFPPGPSQHPVSRSILRHLLNLRQLFFLSIFPIPINPPADPPQ